MLDAGGLGGPGTMAPLSGGPTVPRRQEAGAGAGLRFGHLEFRYPAQCCSGGGSSPVRGAVHPAGPP